MEQLESVDVVVVGTGNAASCAALAAREAGASVVMLDACGEEDRGGNTAYAGGQMRTVFHGANDITKVVADLTEAELATTDFGTYTAADFFDDMARVTGYRCHPELTEHVIDHSLETLVWLRGKGVRFEAAFGRQSSKVDGRMQFWGNLPCIVWGGGAGLIDALHARAAKDGVRTYYRTPAIALQREGSRVTGVTVMQGGVKKSVRAKAVVLACGGFEANAEMRSRYLGPNWDLAKVRGTRFNTGAGLRMALDIGARAYGHWSCAHSSFWELNAPEYGDPVVKGAYQKHSYPFGVVVNARGERFVDEGADFQTVTYARYGREVLAQPGLFAWQVFDQRAIPLLRETYRIRQVTKVQGATLAELASKMEGVDAAAFLETMDAYNRAAPDDESPLVASIKDGLSTKGLALPKSNWARRIDKAPFEAYAVTAGITFTFGGLKINTRAEVEDDAGDPIPGLYTAGEMVGGLFYGNYPSGTGLTCGAVFGRTAGSGAAAFARA
ncbi:MAG: FAD-dependent tricarballylate dehydrogenase TcuA [bacterium]|jgi:tricarballylate dehydrogenase|nr:FAD-dependent tricarballylate dehydrogenase TcuA [Betaproteobacteria bacterium]